MLVHTTGAKCIGIDAVKIIVETQVSRGIGIHLVGLADTAVKESLLRTVTALESVGFHIPGKKIVISLAPADMHKSGSGYDLAIALGIIAASEQLEFPSPEKYVVMGELGLDGSVRYVPGALPIVDMASAEGAKGVILPRESLGEVADASASVPVFGVRTLKDAVRILEERDDCSDLICDGRDGVPVGNREQNLIDFRDIIGQEAAKRGMEIAAAGSHNAILVGSPGSGKSSLAKALAGILPPMTRQESLQTSKIYSVCGKSLSTSHSSFVRPFRSPHYSASVSAIIGGGGGDNIIPGEVSLAHNGVLFLDEFLQIPKSVTEALRGPLEDRCVTVSRLRNRVCYPASFMLVAASNPCPCGYWGEGDRCVCTPAQRQNYILRLSGPIMDRIDLHLVCRSLSASEIASGKVGESSSEIAARVARARELQMKRFAGSGIFSNAEMGNRDIERYCPLDSSCRDILNRLMEKMAFSMRSYFRIIKVARTIADLALSDRICPEHIIEAAGYRFLDRGDVV